MTKKKTFTEQLRHALLTCGKSRYAISMETGVSQGNLSRFVHGDSGMSLETVDLLVEAIGARLVMDPPAKKKAVKKTPKPTKKES